MKNMKLYKYVSRSGLIKLTVSARNKAGAVNIVQNIMRDKYGFKHSKDAIRRELKTL